MSGSSNGSADWIQKNGSGGDSAQQSEARDNDCIIPLAYVVQVMKNALPDDVKISEEAKDMMQESVSDYITFITSEVCQKCLRDKSKEINEADVLSAMSSLASYREVNREDVVTIQRSAETPDVTPSSESPDVTPSQTTSLETACKVKTNSSG